MRFDWNNYQVLSLNILNWGNELNKIISRIKVSVELMARKMKTTNRWCLMCKEQKATQGGRGKIENHTITRV